MEDRVIMEDRVSAAYPRNSAGLAPRVTAALSLSCLSCLSGFVR